MIKLYCKLILNGRRTFETVPDTLKELVKTALNEMGYDTNGDPLPTEV